MKKNFVILVLIILLAGCAAIALYAKAGNDCQQIVIDGASTVLIYDPGVVEPAYRGEHGADTALYICGESNDN